MNKVKLVEKLHEMATEIQNNVNTPRFVSFAFVKDHIAVNTVEYDDGCEM